jgi:hypothetical protein
MHDRRPRRHEKTFQQLKSQAEGGKRNATIIPFPKRRKEVSPWDEIFGTEDGAGATGEPLEAQPNSKLEILPPEKLLLGAAVVVAAILMGLLLLLLLVDGRPS